MSRGLISAAKLLPDTEIKAAPRGGCQAKEKARVSRPPPPPEPERLGDVSLPRSENTPGPPA